MAVMDAEIRDAIYTASCVGMGPRGYSTRTVLPTDAQIRLQHARLARFLAEVDPDLTVSDLLEQMGDDQ